MDANQSQSVLLDYEVRLLVSQTKSLLPSRRKEAQQKLLSRSPEYLEPLLRLFNEKSKNYINHHNTWSYSIEIILWPFILWLTVTLGISIKHTPLIVFLPELILTQLILSKYSSRFTRQAKYPYVIAAALSKYDDKRIIGPIAEVFMVDKYRLNRTGAIKNEDYIQVLIKLLQEIKSESDLDLTVNQIECLNLALGDGSNNLTIAILHALPFIGNERSLTVVKQLSRRIIRTRNQDILSAVNACVPLLEARVARLNVPATLLRPSSLLTENSESLLRPTTSSPDNAPEELLRASAAE